MRDRQRLGRRRGSRELGRGLEHAEEVRLLEDHRRRVLRGLADALRVGRAALVRHLDDLEPEAGRVRLHDRRTCGFVASVTTIFERPVACFATKQASAATVEPS